MHYPVRFCSDIALVVHVLSIGIDDFLRHGCAYLPPFAFRSPSPSRLLSLSITLHTPKQQGFELVPLVISVGDYVLTPQICVERKSLSDLFQSMSSGRLYNQVRCLECILSSLARLPAGLY